MKLNWKMPTWKGAIGLVSFVASVVTYLVANPGTVPEKFAPALGLAGTVLIGIERYADTKDNDVAQNAANVAATNVTAIEHAHILASNRPPVTYVNIPPASSAPGQTPGVPAAPAGLVTDPTTMGAS